MVVDYNTLIDKYYRDNPTLRQVLVHHSRQVADKAMDIAKAKSLDIPACQIEAAAMLHDIGIFRTDAPGIFCYGTEPYICHGMIGAELLRREGMPEWAARVAERHTGAGLSADDIIKYGLPLPHRDFLPETLLEKLVCYADKFFSKSGDMKEKSLDRVRTSMSKFGPDSVSRFEQLHAMFG